MPAKITIYIDPVLFTAGPVTVRWYGVAMFVAILVGVALALREAGRRGYSRESVLYVALWAVPFGILGARLLHVIDAWEYYATQPLQIPNMYQGGLSLYGGLLGGLAGGALAARRRGILSWELLDIAAPSMILGQAIGRVGCFINGDHQGSPTTLPWATSYVHPNSTALDSVARHPTQLYELTYDLAVFGLLLLLRGRLKWHGALFALYAALYSLGRFWISALRVDPHLLLGLREAQLVSAAILLIAVPIMILLQRRAAANSSPPPRTGAGGPEAGSSTPTQ